MEKADSDFLHQLFRENNELRAKFNALQRELYNKTIQNESAEEEIRALKLRLEEGGKPASRPTTQGGHVRKTARFPTESVVGTPATPNVARDLDEAMFTLERKSAEIKAMREELAKAQTQYEDEVVKTGNERCCKGTTHIISVGGTIILSYENFHVMVDSMKRQLTELQEEVHDLRQFRANALKDAENAQRKGTEEVVPDDVMTLQKKLETSEATIAHLKRQVIDIATDANKKHNEQQNQLQGVEALIEGIRREYDEFIEITKMENDSFRSMQQHEYDTLRADYDSHKVEQFEEKKRIMMEYQGLLYSMQAQFDEYRTTAEFLFNAEMAKLEDELSSQAMRYEQEIMYVIQAKDKFYADMMVAKDAKIMSLIEGSDLQNLMQKHEMDMENLRKDHAREIERVRSEQESEQKNLISLLQRQNVSLESKCDKLQSHLKTLEARIKELMTTIEQKNKVISDREEARIKSEADFQRRIDESTSKINALSQEKEHLRHKVIRLNLDAKGEGQNSIENMLKRISRETTDLRGDFEEMVVKYDAILSENQLLSKRLREREKFVEFLEKEIARRTEEFHNMTRTFEDFLSGRAKQSRKERTKRLMNLYGVDDGVQDGGQGRRPDGGVISTAWGAKGGKGVVKPHIPEVGVSLENVPGRARPVHAEGTGGRKTELERGYAYLRRFKTLSRAFATGDFRMVSGPEQRSEPGMPGPWQKTPLYAKLDDANLTVARLYKEPPREDAVKQLPRLKPVVYEADVEGRAPTRTPKTQEIKLYDSKGGVTAGRPKTVGEEHLVGEKNTLMIGGIQAH
ncbi:hypothetical protein HK104_003125 [Borealophlyctis nickersoniae]|nr:hypothetical protein HK104_003125 [Borealophlyctis nickersoniae]